jgi:hypothetical protein
MSLNFRDLDAYTRRLMLEEIETDIASGSIYTSNYLDDKGSKDWPNLLKAAANSHDDAWLAAQLRSGGRLKSECQRRTPHGEYTTVRVPVTAPDTLSEGEFNRYYIRAICRRALENKVSRVTVYRARASENPRPESVTLIGQAVDAANLLADLRATPGVEAALGLAKPNSGLSVTL